MNPPNKYFLFQHITAGTMAKLVTHPSRKTEDLCSNPRYSQIPSAGEDHLRWWSSVLRPIPSGRLKNPRDIDKWSSTRLCLSVRGMSVRKGSNSALCHVVKKIFH